MDLWVHSLLPVQHNIYPSVDTNWDTRWCYFTGQIPTDGKGQGQGLVVAGAMRSGWHWSGGGSGLQFSSFILLLFLEQVLCVTSFRTHTQTLFMLCSVTYYGHWDRITHRDWLAVRAIVLLSPGDVPGHAEPNFLLCIVTCALHITMHKSFNHHSSTAADTGS